jgi:hypothetical protein
LNLTFKNPDDYASLHLNQKKSSFTLHNEDENLFFKLNGKEKIKLNSDSFEILDGSKYFLNNSNSSYKIISKEI